MRAAASSAGGSVALSRRTTAVSGLGPRSYSAMGRAMEALGWRRPLAAHRSSDDVTVVGVEEAAEGKQREKEAAMARGLTV